MRHGDHGIDRHGVHNLWHCYYHGIGIRICRHGLLCGASKPAASKDVCVVAIEIERHMRRHHLECRRCHGIAVIRDRHLRSRFAVITDRASDGEGERLRVALSRSSSNTMPVSGLAIAGAKATAVGFAIRRVHPFPRTSHLVILC